MKNTKKFLSAAAIITLFALITTASAAWYWHWQWQWHWQGWGQGGWKWRVEMQNANTFKTVGKEDKKDCEMDLPPMQELSDYEAERLDYQYSEEMVARDAYAYFYTLYWVETFKKISESEQKHMNVVKKLLDRYWLETPTWYWVLQHEFDVLKAEWEKWLKEALEVWVKIEILDIDDIAETMRNVDNNDILTVYANIWWASYNHMRWFLKALNNNWFTTDIDYSDYLTEEEVESKWWALKAKLSAQLTAEWIVLPESVSEKAILEKMKKNKWKHGDDELNENEDKKWKNSEKNNYQEFWEKKWWWKWKWKWQGFENAVKNKNFTKNAIKWKAYKKFNWELKEKKIFWDSSRIQNEEAVTYLQQRWIISWYEDWTFWPENPVNRAEAIKIILEAIWTDIESWNVSEFTDVPAWTWYTWYVNTAKKRWIVRWYEDWSFQATKTINKVELLKILFKAFEIDLTDYPVTELYADVATDAWFAKYLQYAKDNNLIDADENWNINPAQSMTRDEFSEVVYRLLQQQEAL